MDLWMERDYFIGKCKDCAVVRELTSHQYDSGSVPARCHMWVDFLVGSRSAPRVSIRVLRFSSLHKNQQSRKFKFDLNREAT